MKKKKKERKKKEKKEKKKKMMKMKKKMKNKIMLYRKNDIKILISRVINLYLRFYLFFK